MIIVVIIITMMMIIIIVITIMLRAQHEAWTGIPPWLQFLPRLHWSESFFSAVFSLKSFYMRLAGLVVERFKWYNAFYIQKLYIKFCKH